MNTTKSVFASVLALVQRAAEFTGKAFKYNFAHTRARIVELCRRHGRQGYKWLLIGAAINIIDAVTDLDVIILAFYAYSVSLYHLSKSVGFAVWSIMKDTPKVNTKEEPKEKVKEESATTTIETETSDITTMSYTGPVVDIASKSEPEPEVKEESKPEEKEESKDEPEPEPKDEPKDEPKEESKDEPKEESKEEVKEEVKEESKPEAKAPKAPKARPNAWRKPRAATQSEIESLKDAFQAQNPKKK